MILLIRTFLEAALIALMINFSLTIALKIDAGHVASMHSNNKNLIEKMY